jgi:hypothetical protein
MGTRKVLVEAVKSSESHHVPDLGVRPKNEGDTGCTGTGSGKQP